MILGIDVRRMLHFLKNSERERISDLCGVDGMNEQVNTIERLLFASDSATCFPSSLVISSVL